MRRYPDRVPATELADALDLKPSTLSAYVNALMRVGLIRKERVGTSLRYSVQMETARETFDYLLRDCCRGRPEMCLPLTGSTMLEDNPATDRKYNVLFICRGNFARSIFAEAILRNEAGDRFVAYSAGTMSRSEPNPLALDVLDLNGHDISDLKSKTIAVFQRDDAPRFDFVFTVCNAAANQDCAAWTGQPISAHWGVPDPVRVKGSAAEKTLAFHQTYSTLSNRVAAFAALPIQSLDRVALQSAVDDIAKKDKGMPS